jgi:hypothetical protein
MLWNGQAIADTPPLGLYATNEQMTFICKYIHE